MKSAPFQYHQPKSKEELSGFLTTLTNAKILAGGQSLMAMLNLRLLSPDHLIDINKVRDLAGIALSDGFVEIGAMTRQHELLASPLIQLHLPVLASALHYVGHSQTRSRGTIGGSCCHLDPAAELPAICALYDAQFYVDGANGQKVVRAENWFDGFLQSALGEDEFLEAIRFPLWSQDHGFGFAEYARRHGDYAIVGAGALLECDANKTISRASIVVFGTDSAPVRLAQVEKEFIGQTISKLDVASASDAARSLNAISDVHVTSVYRTRLAGIMVDRALTAAIAQMGSRQ